MVESKDPGRKLFLDLETLIKGKTLDPAVKRRDDEKEEEAGMTKIKRGRATL